MNTNFTGIHITRRDYFKLPAEMRQIDKGPMVLTSVRGRQIFVPAIITK